MIYTVTLNPALDYVMQLPSLLPGDTNRAEGEELQVGGKGINVSLVLAQLGLENIPLRELEEHAPKGMEMETKAVAEKLRQGYALFQGVSQLARDTLECHLRAIEKAQQGEPLVVEDQPRQADFRA